MQNSSSKSGLSVAIDASRNRSGGAQTHLIGILSEGNPLACGIGRVHVWAYKALLDRIPDKSWLIKHNPKQLEQSLSIQVLWQRFLFQSEVRRAGCDIVLNTSAGTVCRNHPCVTIARDMLSYEPREMKRFGLGRARLRLMLLRIIQNNSLRRSDGVIFLTNYAAGIIQKSCGPLDRIAFIPHGAGSDFKSAHAARSMRAGNDGPFRCLYISNVEVYKHQWNVVRAIAELRNRGHDLTLGLIGSGFGKAQEMLQKAISSCDPRRQFIWQTDHIPQKQLPQYLIDADIFIFASSCENLPNTLLEAMSAGLPIACSNRGPMPEVLSDGAEYFDPESYGSIAAAVERLIIDGSRRQDAAHRARSLSDQYSWARCANETWTFLADTTMHHRSSGSPE